VSFVLGKIHIDVAVSRSTLHRPSQCILYPILYAFVWRELDFAKTCQLALVSTFHIAVLLESGRKRSAKSHRMNLVKLLLGSVVEE
jgi:hypothetical protein